MLLKRIFKDRVDGDLFIVDYIDVLHSTPRWHASARFVQRMVAEGWLSIVDGDLIIKTASDKDDLHYQIERAPGHYCCECDRPLDDEHSARRHILSEHAGMAPSKMPTENSELAARFRDLLKMHDFKPASEKHSAGYCRNNFYDCIKQGG